MEKALGIRVVRHITKKPAGDAVDLEKHFRCAFKLFRDYVANDIACTNTQLTTHRSAALSTWKR